METSKQYVLPENVSTSIFFSGVVPHIFLICSAVLFSVYSFPTHHYKLKNIRFILFFFLPNLPLQKSPNSTIFYKTEGNSNPSYTQRPSEAWEEEENETENTPQKDKSKKS